MDGACSPWSECQAAESCIKMNSCEGETPTTKCNANKDCEWIGFATDRNDDLDNEFYFGLDGEDGDIDTDGGFCVHTEYSETDVWGDIPTNGTCLFNARCSLPFP
jgi:hypothetical protein